MYDIDKFNTNRPFRESDFNSRIPRYNDDSDYTTNAPSYYDDLARKNELIKHLAMRIWDYDKELAKRFAAWDKNLEEFDDEVLRLLKEWMEDGTFDEIINEVLFTDLRNYFNNKIDTSVFDYIVLDKTLGDGSDITDELNKVIDIATTHNKGIYIPNGDFLLPEGAHIDMIENIIIDGNIIVPEGKKLTLSYDRKLTTPLNWKVVSVDGFLRIMGTKNLNMTVNNATTFELYAMGGHDKYNSIAYSQFHLGNINNFRIFSQSVEGDGPVRGWVNENAFYGGRFESIFVDGQYTHNNNTFYKPMLENCTIELNRCGSHIFYDCRFEAVNSFYFGELSYDNIFYRSWVSFEGVYLRTPYPIVQGITDDGLGNMVIYEQDKAYTEEYIYQIDKGTKNVDLTALDYNGNKYRARGHENDIFKSEMIPVNCDFGLFGLSDEEDFRFYLKCFDSNEEEIKTDPTEYFSSINMEWDFTHNQFKVTGDVKAFGITVYKNSPVKYVQLRVVRGSRQVWFSYLNIFLRLPLRHTLAKTPYYYTSYKRNSMPSDDIYGKSYFDKGDYVTNSNPVIIENDDGSKYIEKGWLRLTTGDDHVPGVDWAIDKVEV